MNSTKRKQDLGLTPWQKVQAAMLYFYTSDSLLKELHIAVSSLIDGFIDPLLDRAKAQGRDALLVDPVWGSRDTAENWGNYGWPILKDLQASLAEDIARRQSGIFERTAVAECLKGLDEFSMAWATPDEQSFFSDALNSIRDMSQMYDDIVALDRDSRVTDWSFASRYPAFIDQHSQIPLFKVRDDIFANTGEVPPRTGVYVDVSDPNACLQFASAQGRTLREAKTFNDIGIAALNSVGREALWLDEEKMFAFATAKQYASLFLPLITISGVPMPSLASSAVAKQAFTQHTATWFLVEITEGTEPISLSAVTSVQAERNPRIVGGEKCQVSGFYFTPAAQGSRRYFAAGATTPDLDAKYGQTFWQWDENQD